MGKDDTGGGNPRLLAQGVRDALLKHKQAGNPIVVWRDGKIIWIKPEEIAVQ